MSARTIPVSTNPKRPYAWFKRILGARWEPYVVFHWNPGQRKPGVIFEFVEDCFAGVHTDGVPAAAVHLLEMADQDHLLDMLRDAGYVVDNGSHGLADGRKSALVFNPGQVKVLTGTHKMPKIGDAFMGRRHGVKGPRRMANKYAETRRVQDKKTGRLVWHVAVHVWPSVTLQERQVRNLIERLAAHIKSLRGIVILSGDFNMEFRKALYNAMRGLNLLNSQAVFGPDGTFDRGKKITAIDWFEARIFPRYKVLDAKVIDVEGAEAGKGHEHYAVGLIGALRRRARWVPKR